MGGSTVVALLLFSSGCQKSNLSEQNPSSGQIKGKVLVEDQYGRPLYSDRANVVVKLDRDYDHYQTITSSDGQFQFNGLSVGQYSLSASKSGYSTFWRQINFSLFQPKYQTENGAQVIPSLDLVQIPIVNFQDFQLTGNPDNSGVTIDGTMLPAPPQSGLKAGYRIFIHTDPAVGPSHYLYQEHNTTADGNIHLSLTQSQLSQMGIASGDAVYATIYGDASTDINYLDSAETVFPALSAHNSGVRSYMMP